MPRGYLLNLAVVLALPTLAAATGTATLDRPEEPYVLVGADLSGIGNVDLAEIGAFSWRNGGFEPIPFQVDERAAAGGYFAEDDFPGVLDDNDELVFMLEDVGDEADASQWVANASDTRWKVEVEDPLNPGSMGWVYLFTGSGLATSFEDYSTLVSADPMVIETPVYREDFLEGNPTVQLTLDIKAPVGNGTNFLDRLKLRTKLGTFLPWDDEEGSLVDPERWHQKDGPVRVINSFWVSLGDLLDLSQVTCHFYKRVTIVKNQVNQPWLLGVNKMFWMEDLLPLADGTFHYHDNRGAGSEGDATFSRLVSGDQGSREIGESASFNEWAAADYGRAIFVQDTQPILDAGAGSVDSYYCDGCTNDPWDDTGDGETHGQHGTYVRDVPFLTSFSLEAWNFRISGANPETSVGGDYARRYFNRPEAVVTSEDRVPVGIADGVPGNGRGLVLAQNSPNPFNPHTTIRFALPQEAQPVRLAIYDASGRVVATLVDGALAAGDHAVEWDGRDDAGRAVASGVYSYRLETDDGQLTRRMLLVK